MTTDLRMLAWSSILTLVAPLVYVVGRVLTPGNAAWAMGNRDEPFPEPLWVRRGVRAHANLIENLVPFAALVLVAQVAGKANGVTALGSEIFFWARVAHFAVYTAGIPTIRTPIFMVGQLGQVLVLSQLFR